MGPHMNNHLITPASLALVPDPLHPNIWAACRELKPLGPKPNLLNQKPWLWVRHTALTGLLEVDRSHAKIRKPPPSIFPS